MAEITGKTARKKDAILSVCQNNQDKSLKIKDANEHALQSMGLDRIDLVDKDLREILPDKIREAINDHLEFKEEMNDLGDVLTRVRRFAIRNYKGSELPMSLKVLLGEPYGKLPRFDLVMQDLSIMVEIDQQRKAISESLKGYEVIDEITGLPNRTSFLKELEMVNFLVNNKGIEACFAIAEVDDYETMETNYGKVGAGAIFKSIGHSIRSSLREDDSIGVLGNRNFGIILMDANVGNIPPALNRIRYNIGIHPVVVMDFEFPAPKISVGFCQIPKSKTLEDIIKTTEQALTSAIKRGGNFCEAA